MTGWVWECVGGREKETVYSCSLNVLFLVTLKCGKSKSVSLGRLWEEQFKIWEKGKLRSPGGIVSLSSRGGLCGHRSVESQQRLFTLDCFTLSQQRARNTELICRKRNMQPTPHAYSVMWEESTTCCNCWEKAWNSTTDQSWTKGTNQKLWNLVWSCYALVCIKEKQADSKIQRRRSQSMHNGTCKVHFSLLCWFPELEPAGE